MNWDSFFQARDGYLDVDIAAPKLVDFILRCANRFIPKKELQERKSTHPWINQRCEAAIALKNSFANTHLAEEKALECSSILRREHCRYVDEVRQKILALPRNSKQWWKLNRILLENQASKSAVPCLKDLSGHWVADSYQKANLFAKSFQEKFELPAAANNPDSVAQRDYSHNPLSTSRVRTRTARRILEQLDEKKSTGPDFLPAKILRRCARALAIPIAIWVRLMIKQRNMARHLAKTLAISSLQRKRGSV